MATLDVMKIRSSGGNNFDDFDMFLMIAKKLSIASKVYSACASDPNKLDHLLKNIF